MASTTFTDLVTVINTTWLNDVNTLVWTVFNGATTVATARAALGLGTADSPTFAGFGMIDAKGDLLVGTADNTISRLPVGADGYEIHPNSGSAGGLAYLPPRFSGTQILNGTISRSVASSALTVALKGFDGNDPSATNPVYVLIPTVTSNAFDGGYTIRKVTSALSVVISSGSTLGHANNIASPVYVYLLDNAGTLELAISNKFFGGNSVSSTTAEGGAGAADSGTVLYSTTARSNVAVHCLLRWKSTQTTAGTWASTSGEVQLFPFPFKAPSVQVFTTSGANTYTKPWDLLYARVTVIGGGGSGGGVAATGAGQAASAGGGGAGGGSQKTINAASIGPTETATVGAKGAAPAAGNNAGNNGGTSSFGAHLQATGGGGATGGAATGSNTTGGAPGTGGVGSNGDVNWNGTPGSIGITFGTATTAIGGKGGDTTLGSSGVSPSAGSAGNPGLSFGGGGSGAAQTQSGSALAGGAGADGIIIVEEFY